MREGAIVIEGSGICAEYAAEMLCASGFSCERGPGPEGPDPALAWARCGAMALTGHADGPPVPSIAPLAAVAAAAGRAVKALAIRDGGLPDDAAALLGERAATLGLGRQGRTSPGGTCRLLPCADGWIAVNLARAEDLRLIPAWLGEGVSSEDPWPLVAARAKPRAARGLVSRARLLGLAVAPAAAPPEDPPPWCRAAARGPRARSRSAAPLVVDLSGLWAGPLCTHLLERAGARVVKVESATRPDGARQGPAHFFDLLNAGKESVVLDLGSERGQTTLRRLVASADIVVESSRPRALAQLGVDAAGLVRARPGLTWVSITAYGRTGSRGTWVGFGDDAAAAAGLAVAAGRAAGESAPLFCGDAIADPLTGLHAAVAALATWRRGGGALLDVSLRAVAAFAFRFAVPTECRVERGRDGTWQAVTPSGRASVEPPRARSAPICAAPLGADTERVLRELAPGC